MRLAWFSPLPSEHNDPEIPDSFARYLRHVLPELNRRADVTLFTKQHQWSTWIDDWVTVKPISAKDAFWSEVHRADLAIYHLADLPRTYAQYFDLSRTQPGLCVLHESSIHYLVAFTWARFHQRPEVYLEILRRYAGPQAVELGRKWLAEDLDPASYPKQISLLEYLMESALSCVSHSPVFEPPEGLFRIPSKTLALPYSPSITVTDDESTSDESIRRIVLMADAGFDFFQPLEVLAVHPIQPLLKLSLIVPEAQHPNLIEALTELRLMDRTTLYAGEHEPAPRACLETADLVWDVRKQGLEQDLSYRTFELWQLGAPVSLPLPDDHPWIRRGLTLGLREGRRLEDMRRQTDLLFNAPDRLREMGQTARRYLSQAHSPARYVQSLLEISGRSTDQLTAAAGRRYTGRFRNRSAWLPDACRRDVLTPVASFLDLINHQPAASNPQWSLKVSDKSSTGPAPPSSPLLTELSEALAAERRAREASDARLAELEKRLAEALGASPAEGGSPSPLETYYLAFENRFRGSREQIKGRMEVYGPQLLEIATRFPGELCLDLGCGQGEWLEILASQGLRGLGIDSNEAMVEACRERDLDVRPADGLEMIADLESSSVALVTGFHIIEHLPSFESLASLFAEAFRVLIPGGLAIFESPNPENLTVGACSFYLDHTHEKPLHPEAVNLLFKSCGFEEVDCLRLVHGRVPEPPFEAPDPEAPMAEEMAKVFRLLNNHLLAAPDFAVVGRRPLDRE